MWKLYGEGYIDLGQIKSYQESHPVLTLLLFIFVYALSVAGSLPTLPLNLAAGFFWGGVIGGTITAFSVTLGSWVSFFLARQLLGQPLTREFDNKWLGYAQTEFKKSGWKFLAFMRVNPVIPTGPLNYVLGLTSVSTATFLWTAMVFLLPPAIAVAYIGDVLQTFTVENADVQELVRNIIYLSGAITVVATIRYIFHLNSKKGKQ